MDARHEPKARIWAGFPVRALSIGGIETCYELPSLDLCLDIGRCPPGAENRKRLFLTHGHIDHAAGLPYYVSLRSLIGASRPTVYCPAPSKEALEAVLAAWIPLQTDTDQVRLVGLEPGDEVPLKGGVVLRCFQSSHRIATLGYVISTKLRKLKPDYQGRPSAEIASLVRSGVQISDEVSRPDLCFPGDTRIEVVEREEAVRKARVLLLECTFLEDVSVEKARKGGHVQISQIAERADLFENETIVLTHFSRRYSKEQIDEAVARLPERLRTRIELLL